MWPTKRIEVCDNGNSPQVMAEFAERYTTFSNLLSPRLSESNPLSPPFMGEYSFQLGLAYVFYTAGIQHVTALEGILIPVLEPLLNPVWVFIGVGEKPSMLAIIGGVIVMAAVVIRNVSYVRSTRSARSAGLAGPKEKP